MTVAVALISISGLVQRPPVTQARIDESSTMPLSRKGKGQAFLHICTLTLRSTDAEEANVLSAVMLQRLDGAAGAAASVRERGTDIREQWSAGAEPER